MLPCSDPKLLPKMEAAVEAAQTASAYLCLVKFCLLMVGAAARLVDSEFSTTNRRCRCLAAQLFLRCRARGPFRWWRCMAVARNLARAVQHGLCSRCGASESQMPQP